MTTFEMTLICHGKPSFKDIIICSNQAMAISIIQSKWPNYTVSGVRVL